MSAGSIVSWCGLSSECGYDEGCDVHALLTERDQLRAEVEAFVKDTHSSRALLVRENRTLYADLAAARAEVDSMKGERDRAVSGARMLDHSLVEARAEVERLREGIRDYLGERSGLRSLRALLSPQPDTTQEGEKPWTWGPVLPGQDI